jgi:uncharacterized membrane protein YoaK (UPF0700 family)
LAAATPHEDLNELGSVVTGLLGVAAMAVQNAGSRLILANHGPTTMMTGNTTQAVIDLVDLVRGFPEEHPEARRRLKLLVPAISRVYRRRVARRLRLCHLLVLVSMIPIVALLAVAWMVAAGPRSSA